MSRYKISTRKMWIAILGIASAFTASAYEWNDSIRWNAEVEADFAVGRHTPFWMVSNRQGITSLKRNNGYVRLSAFHDMDEEKRFSWGAGADLIAGWNLQSPFRVQQLYVEAKYRCLDAMLGQKEIWGEFSDPRLSSGNLLYSGNARPIPQLRLGIFDYADFWGCNGWFAIKGYLSYGMMTDSRWQRNYTQDQITHTEDVLYHSKGIWFKGGNADKFPLVFEFGIETATQFGGRSYRVNPDGYRTVWVLPKGIKDWVKALIPLAATNHYIDGEMTNVQGNFVGAWNFALSWMPKADWSIMAYYQHYYEDHSMLFFEYPWKDGLWGVRTTFPKNRFVNAFVYEFLYAKDQAGAVNHDYTANIPEQVSGRDGYYGHYIYNGWQHWGMGIGNPLSLSPLFNTGISLSFKSTRIIGNHLGFEGNPWSEINYRLLLSHTSSWGTYSNPLPEVAHDFSGMLEVGWSPKKLSGWTGTIALAGDYGDLLGKNLGLMMRISKTGWLFKSKKR